MEKGIYMKKFIIIFSIVILFVSLIYKLNNKQNQSSIKYSAETITKEQLREYIEGVTVSQIFLKTYNMAMKMPLKCISNDLKTRNFVKTLARILPFNCVQKNEDILLIQNEDRSYTQYEFHMDGICKKENACYVTRLDNGSNYGNYTIPFQLVDGKLVTQYNYTIQEEQKLFKAFIIKNKKQGK